MKIDIMIPCYNEVNNVEPMYEAVKEQMRKFDYRYRIIFVDNGSIDGTTEKLRLLAKNNKDVRVLINNRNYGVDGRSGRNAYNYLSGDAIVVLACDFQDPPELIPEFIKGWEEGYKVVCGKKTSSKEGWLKYHLRDAFYKIINFLSDIPQYNHLSGITLMDRNVLEEYKKTDYDYYFRFALADMGYDVKIIEYEQQARKSGKSSYNVWRYLTFAIDSMIITSRKPIRIITVMGIFMSLISFLIGVFYLVSKILHWHMFSAGTAPILIGLFFFASVQMLMLGIIGEYIGAILRKVTNGPDVIIKEKLNFEEDIG